MRNSRTQKPSLQKNHTSPLAASEGIVVVDASFKPIALYGGADAILHELGERGGVSDDNDSLPNEILNLLNGRPRDELAALHVHVNAGDHEYACRAFVIKPPADTAGDAPLALHIRREVSVTDAVHQVGVDYHLTDREQEALIGVSMGLTSKELATRMNISPNTVKAFLRLIMIKMGATTRAGVVGKLLEQNGRTSDT